MESKPVPVECPIKIANLTTDEFRKLDYTVMAQIFESQNFIGRLANEGVYRTDVAERLAEIQIGCRQELPIYLSYLNFQKTLYIDLTVAEAAVYELKAVTKLTPDHIAQLLTYLYLLELSLGKLVNFRPSKVESQFVNAPISRDARCSFDVESRSYRGSQELMEIAVGLVRDWGTCLSASLYQEAMVCLLGGSEVVEQLLPLARDGKSLGNQRFLLVNENQAFQLSAYSDFNDGFVQHLNKLLKLSPLRAIHWINIGTNCVTLKTVDRG